MIPLTFDKIWEAILCSGAVGAACSVVYCVINALLSFRCKQARFREELSDRSDRSIIAQTFDFAFFSVVGLMLLLIGYAFCDGVISLYPTASFLATFILARKFLSKLTKICLALCEKCRNR